MKILIVGVQHGNEIFGAKVIDHCKQKYQSVDGVIANPRAHKENVRFCETDMNRSYNAPSISSYEEKRAAEVLELSKRYDFVIDIHTTTADMDFVPIIADYNHVVARALSFLPNEEVVKMEFPTVKNSLIGSVQNSLSLEFNEDFAESDKALEIIDDLVVGMLSEGFGEYRSKTIYHTSEIISDKADISGEKNLVYSDKLGCYPILIGEKHYVGYSGFGAKSVSRVSIG
ncbi:hypothetical protein CR969_01470 [Candidatus Saccharibacteria bacterium]|nr:MAG: hypothetical protein CR969_01470 [Candidatus Saccharibacteria bacterium]